MESIEEGQSAREKTIAGIQDKKEREDAKNQLKDDYVLARTNLTVWKMGNREYLNNEIHGAGVFDSFASYEWNCVSNAITAVGNGNILGGWLSPALLNSTTDPFTGRTARNWKRDAGATSAAAASPGFVYYVIQAVGGVKWLLTQHTLFGIILLVLALAVWRCSAGQSTACPRCTPPARRKFPSSRRSSSPWANGRASSRPR